MQMRLILLALAMAAPFARAGDWPMFRGPDRDGKSSDTKVPLEWGKEKNVRWRAELQQAGNSSPIVSAGRVFVTCAQDAKGVERSLYCFDRATGKQAWVKTVTWERADPTYPDNPYCASTPAADGERVVVWHGSAGLFCYDFAGNELWKADLGVFKHIWGYASSPVIHGDRIYLNCGPGQRSFVVALDKRTGKVIWQADEPRGGPADKDAQNPDYIGSWSTGLVTQVDGQEQLLVFQAHQVNGYDLARGKILWSCGGAGPLAYTDVVVGEVEGVGKIGIALAGYGGKGIGVKLGGSGDTTATHRLWQSTAKPPQRIGSGMFVDGKYFVVNEPGIECIDPATGKTLWKHASGEGLWSSLVATPGRLYISTHKGKTLVFAADPKEWKLLATNDLGERINATPAISEGQIFIRSWKALYCIGE